MNGPEQPGSTRRTPANKPRRGTWAMRAAHLIATSMDAQERAGDTPSFDSPAPPAPSSSQALNLSASSSTLDQERRLKRTMPVSSSEETDLGPGDTTAAEDGHAHLDVASLSQKLSRLRSPVKVDTGCSTVPRVSTTNTAARLFSSDSRRATPPVLAQQARMGVPYAADAKPERGGAQNVDNNDLGLVPFPTRGSIVPAGTARAGVTGTGTPAGHQLVPVPRPIFTLANSSTAITSAQYAAIKKEQRSEQNYWKTAWAFPEGPGRIMEREALYRCTQFVCYGCVGCKTGDCLCVFGTHDVWDVRRQAAGRLETLQRSLHNKQDASMIALMHRDVWPHWDG